VDELEYDSWFGWLYQRGRWKNVCSAGDIGSCARKLHDLADKHKVKDRNTFLTYGRQTPRTVPGESLE
jgi:hypothetical protein